MGRRALVVVAGAVAWTLSLAAAGLAGAWTPARQAAPPSDTQTRAVEDVLMAQLAAFNRGDVEALVANVAEDFAWVAVDSDGAAVQLVGRAQFRRSMEAYFASTFRPRAELAGLLVSGAFASVIERAYWIDGDVERSQDALAVYEVRDGLIYRVWYYPTPEAADPAGGV